METTQEATPTLVVQEPGWGQVFIESSFTLVAVVLVIAAMVYVAKLYFTRQQKEKEAQEKKAADADSLQNPVNFDRLDRMLKKVEANQGKAKEMARDISMEVHTLAGLIVAFVHRLEDYQAEIAGIDMALDALASNDKAALTRAAGRLEDKTLGKLCLSTVTNEQYWKEVSMTLNAQAGVLQLWVEKYEVVAVRLLGEVRILKARLAQLNSAVEMIDACRPLLTASNKILATEQTLLLTVKPDNRTQLTLNPTVYTTLLDARH